jgi:predicted nucleic acid-binding protein
MRQVFADAHYWVAILNDQDQSHTAAESISTALHGVPVVTTEEVLTEVLAFFSERGQSLDRLVILFPTQ